MLITFENWRGLQASWPLRGSWVSLFIVICLRMQAMVSNRDDQSTQHGNFYVFGLLTALSGVLCFSALYLNKTTNEDAYALLAGENGGNADAEARADALAASCKSDVSPFDEARLPSRVLFSWLDALLRVGFASPLQAAHMLPVIMNRVFFSLLFEWI